MDPEDYARLAKYKWHLSGRRGAFYAARCMWVRSERKTKSPKMHREIMKVDDNLYIDHINGDGLDNRKANLRAATALQNSWNSQKTRRKSWSRYKGVTWNKRGEKWISQIQANGKIKFIGRFDDEVQAAKAYDRAAKEYHGEFAALNFDS